MNKQTRDDLRRRYGTPMQRASLLNDFNNFLDSTGADVIAVLDALERAQEAYRTLTRHNHTMARRARKAEDDLARLRQSLTELRDRWSTQPGRSEDSDLLDQLLDQYVQEDQP